MKRVGKFIIIASLLAINSTFGQGLDASLGNDGIVVTDISKGVDRLLSIVIQSDEKIVVVRVSNSRIALLR